MDCDLDVSLAHPWCLDIELLAATKEGTVASKRGEKKEASIRVNTST